MATQEERIARYVIDYMSDYGLILWHISKHGSVYLKFKDTRLGSIRIADHRSTKKYTYKYEINSTDRNSDIRTYVKSVIYYNVTNLILNRLEDFDKDKYIVYNRDLETYIELDTYEQFRNHILKKRKKK